MNDDINETLINIDGIEIKTDRGSNIVTIAEKLGVEIPHYCYHPQLSVAGNCRMCLVEIGKAKGKNLVKETGEDKINWLPKPVAACATKISPGMYIRTKSSLIKKARRSVIEFLLANHPLDCPICDKAGECGLQEYAATYGRKYGRFYEDKNKKNKNIQLGQRIVLDNERCILCSRCIRFCKEIVNDNVIGFIDRGSYTTLSCHPDRKLNNNYSVNTVDVCPVGALTSTDFRFKMRIWFLKQTISICTESSTGVNTTVWSREDKIYRITPRFNKNVNSAWMPDSGRYLYKIVNSKNRLIQYKINGRPSSSLNTLNYLNKLISQSKNAVVINGDLSVEEFFLIKKIVNFLHAKVYTSMKLRSSDGFLISSDRSPNIKGAILAQLIDKSPKINLRNLAKDIKVDRIRNLIVFGQNLVRNRESYRSINNINIIFLGTHDNFTASISKIVIPTLTVFEKPGTFINKKGRLQKFYKAVQGYAEIQSNINQINNIYLNLTNQPSGGTVKPDDLWLEISKKTKCLNGLNFSTIPETGISINQYSFDR